MRTLLLAVAVAGFAATTGIAHAITTHRFDATRTFAVVDAGGVISQTAANTAAAGLTDGGATGFLATITSQAEQDFITSLLGSFNAWIGLRAETPSAVGNPNDFKWIGGPESGDGLTYQSWASDGGFTEPTGSEKGVTMTGSSGLLSTVYDLGDWVDIDDSGSSGVQPNVVEVTGYVVEFTNPIPLPAGAWMLLSAFGAAAVVRKRLKAD